MRRTAKSSAQRHGSLRSPSTPPDISMPRGDCPGPSPSALLQEELWLCGQFVEVHQQREPEPLRSLNPGEFSPPPLPPYQVPNSSPACERGGAKATGCAERDLVPSGQRAAAPAVAHARPAASAEPSAARRLGWELSCNLRTRHMPPRSLRSRRVGQVGRRMRKRVRGGI